MRLANVRGPADCVAVPGGIAIPPQAPAATATIVMPTCSIDDRPADACQLTRRSYAAPLAPAGGRTNKQAGGPSVLATDNRDIEPGIDPVRRRRRPPPGPQARQGSDQELGARSREQRPRA